MCFVRHFIMLKLFCLSLWQVRSAEQTKPSTPFHNLLRQDVPADMVAPTDAGNKFDEGLLGFDRFKTSIGMDKDRSKAKKRTTPMFISRPHYCDYWARPCMHSYKTGKLCARTVNYWYQTFDNYCLMEYVNCRENYEVWQAVYMGACFGIPALTDFIHVWYHDDAFLDNYYLLEDKFNT